MNITQAIKLMTLFSIIMTEPLALGSEWDIERNGAYHILAEQSPSIKIEAATDPAVLDCAEVNEWFRSNQRAVDRCTGEGIHPRSYCSLLKEDLRRSFAGETSSIVGRPESTEFSWRLSLNHNHPSQQALQDYMGLHRLEQGQVKVAALGDMAWGDALAEGKASSWTKRLTDSHSLGWSPRVELIARDELLTFRTFDRVTACEILSGKVAIQLAATANYHYEVPKDFDALSTHWEFYRRLVETWEGSAERPEEFAVVAGFMVAQELSSLGVEASRSEALTYAQLFLSLSTSAIELRSFASLFNLGEMLEQSPQEYRRYRVLNGSL